MPDRGLNRPERRSAGTALAVTALAHAGLIAAVLWPARLRDGPVRRSDRAR